MWILRYEHRMLDIWHVGSLNLFYTSLCVRKIGKLLEALRLISLRKEEDPLEWYLIQSIGHVLADNVYSGVRCIATRNQDIGDGLTNNIITSMQLIHIGFPFSNQFINLWMKRFHSIKFNCRKLLWIIDILKYKLKIDCRRIHDDEDD